LEQLVGWAASGLIQSIVDLAQLEQSLATWIQLLPGAVGWFKDWECCRAIAAKLRSSKKSASLSAAIGLKVEASQGTITSK